MVSPGLEPPYPPENPLGLPIFRPEGLRFPFPPGWTVTYHVASSAWSAEKGPMIRCAMTEGSLFALVREAEAEQARKLMARL